MNYLFAQSEIWTTIEQAHLQEILHCTFAKSPHYTVNLFVFLLGTHIAAEAPKLASVSVWGE